MAADGPPDDQPDSPPPRRLGRRRAWNATAATHILAIVGIVLVAISIAGLIGNRSQPVFRVLFLPAVVLLFLAAILAVRHERPLIQFLVYLGAALCLISAAAAQSLIGHEATSAAPQTDCALFYAPTPTAFTAPFTGIDIAPTPTPVPATPPPGVELAAKWPRNMDIEGSDFVGVTLTHRVLLPVPTPGSPLSVPTIEVAGKTCRPTSQRAGNTLRRVATPIGVGTPGVPLEKAFGHRYSQQVSASAVLDAIKFDLTPNNPTWQALDQREDDWGWTITPRAVGRQVMVIDVTVRWQGTGNTKPPSIERLIWESDPIYVNVQAPLIATGQFNVSALLSGALATGAVTLVTALIAKFLPSSHEKEG